MMVLLLGLWFSVAIFLLGIPRDHCTQIIGGKKSSPHSRPYMAKIKGNFLCGGTLIKPNWVLTAAHCEVTTNTQVILGINSEKDKTKEIFKVIKHIPHPCYDKDRKNDIMLLQLNKQAKRSKYIDFVKLPQVYNDLKAGTACLVAGWGTTQNETKIPSDVLREVNVSVIERSICNDKSHYNHQPPVTTNMVCAGDKKGGKDSCAGDSGGPLICNGVQRAIVSFGKGCGNPWYPGVYTLLTDKYARWIESIIGGSL